MDAVKSIALVDDWSTLQATVAAAFVTYVLYSYISWDERSWWVQREKAPFLHVASNANWKKELIHGHVVPGWEAVEEEFIENFRRRGELGAAVCIYYRGKKVVDLWGGYKQAKGRTCQKWERDTLVNVFSTTKGISALAVALQHSRGKIDYDAPVSRYWPEFAQHGKEEVTVRELLSHKVGVAGPSPPIDLDTLEDVEATNAFLAKAQPEWSTGDKAGYMAVLLGNYASTLIQKTTSDTLTMGQFVGEEICRPLGIGDELYIGLPKCFPERRIAKIDSKVGLELLKGGCFPPGFLKKLILDSKSYVARSLNNPRLAKGFETSIMNYNKKRVREVELPGANGHATARALAKVYSAAERAINSMDDNPLGFSKETMDELQKPAQPNRLTKWYDEVLLFECPLALGFTKTRIDDEDKSRFVNFGSDSRAFGTGGAGGSFAFCDPHSGLSFAYIMNRGGDCIFDDPREFALRTKAYACAQNLRNASNEEPLPMDRLTTPHYLVADLMKKYPFLAPLQS